MKVDIAMWTKDGAWVLPKVLTQLEKVIPSENIHRKIMVDDHSGDNTVEVGKDFNWEIYENPITGISCGANYALGKVDCDYFISIEQDLFLSSEWWNKIPNLLSKDDVAVASGVRFSDKPSAVHDLEKYICQKYLMAEKLSPYLVDRPSGISTLGKTLDNTIYKTKVIKAIGGFPVRRSNIGIDPLLIYTLFKNGYNWAVDPFCQSKHIRHGLHQVLKHCRWSSMTIVENEAQLKKLKLNLPRNKTIDGFKVVTKRFLMSIGVGVFVSLAMKNPMISLVYPLMRFYSFVGYLDGKRNERMWGV